MSSRVHCLLVMQDGTSRRVGVNGILVGRQTDCDLVSLDPAMSRRHALVRVTSEGAEVVPLGRGPVVINGKPTDRPQVLADGDALTFPGLTLSASITRHEAADVAAIVLERSGGAALGIGHTPFRIGGGTGDDLVLRDWPPSALAIHVVDQQLFVEYAETRPGDRVPVAAGERIEWRGETFTFSRSVERSTATTAATAEDDVPHAVEIELLPRGGLVVFTLASGPRSVFLADRRLDLLVALLQPPDGQEPGAIIGDDQVRAVVWPRAEGVGRTEINVLISRCRKDLVEAGLNGPRLIQRAPGGGGTRFVLARGATVTIKR